MNTKIILFIIILLGIVGVGYLLGISNIFNGTTPSTSTTIPGEALEIPEGVAIPNLDREIVIPNSIPIDIAEQTRITINRTRETLKENPNQLAPWLDLGLLYKSIDDFHGAEEVWLFVTKIRPNDWLAYHNLADLYGYYLKDAKNSEEYILIALEKAPKDAQIYVKAYEIYKDVVGNLSPMKKIIEEGLLELPDDETLLSIQSLLEQK